MDREFRRVINIVLIFRWNIHVYQVGLIPITFSMLNSTLLHSERSKLDRVLAVLSATGLNIRRQQINL